MFIVIGFTIIKGHHRINRAYQILPEMIAFPLHIACKTTVDLAYL